MDVENNNYYQQEIKELTSGKKESLSEIYDLNHKHLTLWRSFVSTLLTIDVAIIAAALGTLSSEKQEVFNTICLSYLGVFILVINVILIIFYCTRTLYRDEISINKQIAFLRRTHEEMIDLFHSSIKAGKLFKEFEKEQLEMLKGFAEEERLMDTQARRDESSPLWLPILSFLFVLGIVIVLISVFNFNVE